MKFFNTLSRRKEFFKPLSNKKVGIYTCGPTVYDFAHIGNFRAYLFSDLLVRYLKFKNYKLKWVMNITDIDDKTIKGAKEAGLSLAEFTKKYEKEFFEDLKKLNIQKANFYPRATEHIKEIQDLIRKLLKKGYAYEKDGSIYFNISKFKNYGKLSKIDLFEIKHGVRISEDLYEKKKAGDFVLWKAKKPGEPFWRLAISDKRLAGRPGWHIECSAMSVKYLGQPFDIHTGGVDLIFPHHENEIAQSEGANSKIFASYFLHNEHLLVEGQKMAKSLGNYYTLRDLIKKGYDPIAFRYLCLQSHHRSKMNFTWEGLKAAENSLKEIRRLGFREKGLGFEEKDKKEIEKALNNDLDTPVALALLHQKQNYNLWLFFDSVFGLGLRKLKTQNLKLKREIKKLVERREKLRKLGKFRESDIIRKEIEKKGYEIEDTEKGPRILEVRRCEVIKNIDKFKLI